MQVDKRLAGLAVFVFGGVSPALALTPAAMEPAFENTIVSTYEDGRTARLWLDPDGRYRGEGRNHDPSNGKWTIKGEKLCLKQSRPVPVPFAFCTPIVQGGVGTAWSTKSVFGEPLKVELVSGR
jgi:hypothetical protein